MTNPSPQTATKNIGKKADFFFPEDNYTLEQVESEVDLGTIFVDPTRMLPYLQTALLDEQIMEVELDGMTRIYYTRLSDELPELVEQNIDGEIILTEQPYTAGEYLKAMTQLIILPLEPGIGNLHIKGTQRVVLRIFTRSGALEFGTFFQEMTQIRDMPVLRLAYPVIGRLVKGARAYRAPVPAGLKCKLVVVGINGGKDLLTRPLEISAHEIFFRIEKEDQAYFTLDEPRDIRVTFDQNHELAISGSTLQVEKIRGKKGLEYRCGIHFDLKTRSLAAEIEANVALVQRAHLKELAEKAEASGLDLSS